MASGSPIAVLVADDHPIFRRGLLDVLRAAPGIKIAGEASDGEAALSFIINNPPDVAILDVQMPRMTGLDAARALFKRGAPCAVAFLTMYDDEDTLREAMDLGVLGYVLKESAVEEIVGCVQTIASGRHFISPSLSGHLVRRMGETKKLAGQKSGISLLTPSEIRILKLIASDCTTKEIADQLEISPRTVETHRQNICAKLDLHGIHSLVKFAFENKGRL